MHYPHCGRKEGNCISSGGARWALNLAHNDIANGQLSENAFLIKIVIWCWAMWNRSGGSAGGLW